MRDLILQLSKSSIYSTKPCAIFTLLRRSSNYLRRITASFFWPAILMLKWAEKREI
ncbi:hypothetical protein GYB86_001361 [Salmonella enterica]|nr:hypothetical protein [Salmonella enterica]